jgi:hypothetical protein
MEHPWILIGSIILTSPLIWLTFQFFFPNLREDLQEDGVWLLLAFTDLSVGTCTLAKFLWLVLMSAAYVYFFDKVASLLFG